MPRFLALMIILAALMIISRGLMIVATSYFSLFPIIFLLIKIISLGFARALQSSDSAITHFSRFTIISLNFAIILFKFTTIKLLNNSIFTRENQTKKVAQTTNLACTTLTILVFIRLTTVNIDDCSINERCLFG